MSFSSGSQRMIDYWEGYEKPTPKEARRRKRERDLNTERLPWVNHFTVPRECEGKHTRPCKVSAFWAYVIPSAHKGFETPGACLIVCTWHLQQLAIYDKSLVNAWFSEHGWIAVNDDGTTTEIPYR